MLFGTTQKLKEIFIRRFARGKYLLKRFFSFCNLNRWERECVCFMLNNYLWLLGKSPLKLIIKDTRVRNVFSKSILVILLYFLGMIKTINRWKLGKIIGSSQMQVITPLNFYKQIQTIFIQDFPRLSGILWLFSWWCALSTTQKLREIFSRKFARGKYFLKRLFSGGW